MVKLKHEARMSEQPKPLENVVVSGSGGYKQILGFTIRSPRLLRKHPRWVLAVVIVFVLVAGTGSVLWVRHDAANRLKLEEAQAQATKPKTTIADQAQTLENNQSYTSAQTYLDAQISQTTSKTTLGSLYESKASLALSNKDYQSALEYAQNAETLNPTSNSAMEIAQCEELLGNKQAAIEYYQKVIARTNPNLDDYTIPGLQARIKQLGG